MGKPARWLKSVLLGKKSSKSSGSKDKERAVNGKEVVVVSKIEESDVVSDLPSFGTATVSTSAAVEAQKIEEHEVVSDDEIQIPESQAQPTDSPTAASVVVPDDSLSDSEKIQQEVAATTLQAAFRGYLARRAFWALKGIIRLQAVIRGHMVRRQAVATLCCVMGIVRLQALARGSEIRRSDIGVEVHRRCRLNHHQHLQENKLPEDSVVETHTYLGIKKLTANAFAQKLLASSPNVMPVHLDNGYSNSIWLEKWSASCFWKPGPQPKKTSVRKTQKKFEGDFAKQKKSVRKVPAPNQDNPSAAASAQTSFEFEKPKRSSFRKFSTSQSVELPPLEEPPQVDLEKVKRGLRKVHNPVVESSIQPQPSPEKLEIEKPALALEQPVSVFAEEEKDETAETVVEIVHTHGPLETNEAPDSPLVIESQENVMAEEKEEDVKEERTPKQKNSAGKENKKSRKKDSPVTTTTTTTTTTQAAECQESSDVNQSSTPGLPSYMQATKSAKAKLRLQQGSSSPKQQGAEKATRRYSLPSSGNNARVTSDSPKTTRVSNSGGKTGKKTEKPSAREGNGKTAQVEWKR
ncbi:protein IQ-DOMAIN 30-like isoform X1 [Raphanus sativus]|uniref:Protein IQ-DOMAIN 30-like isoform X1 n=1 Tax=Raphanus sativus TaxID=3726 RepID=A0A6J0KUN3_RAPSA|nr:protein IQ-DOMAIN 30-like isoform X1 [Raphanus sativus]